MTLLLNTPDQHDFQDPTLELNEKRLHKWLGSLPVLDAGESLRQVLNALEPLNEQRLESDKRLRLLGIYLPVVQRLYENAEPIRLRKQPLSKQQRQDTVDDIERLSLALANGFKIVINQWVAEKRVQQDIKAFGRLLRWSLQQVGASLVHAFRYYRSEPPFVFFELNQLYRLARHYGVHDQLDDGDNVRVPVSLAGVYQALAMLSLCDPFSLQEGQVDLYYKKLLQSAHRARVVPGNSWQGVPEGLFFIDLKSDSRPRHCVHLQSPVDGDDPYILDARVPLQLMHKTLVAIPEDRRQQRIETGMLRVMLPEVASPNQRREKRKPAGNWIEVVTGIENTIAWLEARKNDRRGESKRWQIKDKSETGYRLAWNENAASLLQVGELICVVGESDSEQECLQLLMVRWLHNERGNSAELGVEKLPGIVNSVNVQLAEDTDAILHPALFLPSTGAQGSIARLIVYPGIHQPDRRLSIFVGEREVPVRCGQLVHETPVFECFEFTAA